MGWLYSKKTLPPTRNVTFMKVEFGGKFFKMFVALKSRITGNLKKIEKIAKRNIEKYKKE